MITNVNQLRAVAATDPFQQFDVEFQSAVKAPKGLDAVEGAGAPSFGDALAHALEEVSAQEHKAQQTAFDFATGKPVDVHTMMIEMAKADVLVQVTSSVVSKTAQGINQLLQTQI
jgi:flagellar hook-basal body complex protein FliE